MIVKFLRCQIQSFSGIFHNLCLELHNLLLFSQGVNRAFPFVSSDEADDIIDVQTPVLFQLVVTTQYTDIIETYFFNWFLQRF